MPTHREMETEFVCVFACVLFNFNAIKCGVIYAVSCQPKTLRLYRQSRENSQ